MDLVLTILQNGQNLSSHKLPSNKSLLVLGDNETGKTSLIAKIQGNDDPKKGSGLEYHHLLVRDEYRDEQTRLGVWVLDGDPYHTNLLKFPVDEANFEDITLILVASMSQPWNILESLENWANIFEQHVRRMKISDEKLTQCRNLVLKKYLEYISPGDDIENLVQNTKSRSESITEKLDTAHINLQISTDQLEDNVLSNNLGVDTIVVITKTDYMPTLETDYDYKEEYFDFIQQAIRKFCLKYGASLVYVSAKIDKNCDLLYKYIVHRVYGLPFRTPALVVEKDAVFIPAGWDNEKKISILYENIQSCSPDDDYNDVIKKIEKRQQLQKEVETVAEDDQVFLLKMQSQLNQNLPTTNNGSSPKTPMISKATDRRSVTGTPPGSSMDGNKNNPGEGVLQNFFNSLLNRKSGGAVSMSPSPSQSPSAPSIDPKP